MCYICTHDDRITNKLSQEQKLKYRSIVHNNNNISIVKSRQSGGLRGGSTTTGADVPEAKEEDCFGILSSKKKKKKNNNKNAKNSFSSVCGVRQRCKEVLSPLSGVRSSSASNTEEAGAETEAKKSEQFVDLEGREHPHPRHNAHHVLQKTPPLTGLDNENVSTTTTTGTATFETTKNADGTTTTTVNTINTGTTDDTITTSDNNNADTSTMETITTINEAEEIVVDTILTKYTYLCNYG